MRVPGPAADWTSSDAAVALRDFLDDREAESRAVARRPLDPVEALEHALARGLRNAGAAVLDAQECDAFVEARAHGHAAA